MIWKLKDLDVVNFERYGSVFDYVCIREQGKLPDLTL